MKLVCRTAYALKCDIKKFFDSIDHAILLRLIQKEVTDAETLDLISAIIASFEKSPGKGLPLGNVTSQLFANIYLHELDFFVKHRLKVRYYFRYCDNFVILDESRQNLIIALQVIKQFLQEELLLTLHPYKVTLRKVRQGIDFLGYVILPHRLVLRTKTKRRVYRKIVRKKKELLAGHISQESFQQSAQSYLGILKHCKGKKIERKTLALIDGRRYIINQ